MPNTDEATDDPSPAEHLSLEEEASKDAVAAAPSDTGDPAEVVNEKIPVEIRNRFEVFSYRNAAVILSETRRAEFDDLLKALNNFKMTTAMIIKPGKNESDMPKLLSTDLRPLGWNETMIQGDLVVRMNWRERAPNAKGRMVSQPRSNEVRRERYLDGHKIDYVKGRVAFDLEWNSKDQTFDRDLYAFAAFFQCGVIDAAVLVTRSKSLDEVFRRLGPVLKQDGSVDRKPSGAPKWHFEKYGASTTWMGKLLYRLNAGRNGGCPVLALGIKPECIEDWDENRQWYDPAILS